MSKVTETNVGCHIYIECSCNSFDHLVKLGFLEGNNYEEGEFYIEFKHQKFPILNRNCHVGKFYKLNKIKYYIQNIWCAIKGKSNRYTLESLWSYNQAKQIKEFIEYCTKRYNLKEGE